MARCSKCSDACGDDHKTLTVYTEEKNVGDRMKVILLQLNDMADVDNLQIAEMKALVNSLIDEHFYEEDDLKKDDG